VQIYIKETKSKKTNISKSTIEINPLKSKYNDDKVFTSNNNTIQIDRTNELNKIIFKKGDNSEEDSDDDIPLVPSSKK
jgi:hypothetical protein